MVMLGPAAAATAAAEEEEEDGEEVYMLQPANKSDHVH